LVVVLVVGVEMAQLILLRVAAVPVAILNQICFYPTAHSL